MDIFNLNYVELLGAFLTLIRISVVVFMLPVFGGDSIPVKIKAYLAVILTMALWPSIGLDGALFPTHPFGLIVLVLGELIIGLVLSLMVQFVFAGIQTGGHFIGAQMGFTMVTIMDPMSGGQLGLTSHYLYMVAVLIFFICNGHLLMLLALGKSFSLVKPGQIFLSPDLTKLILALSSDMFMLALHIAAPVIVALFTVELALALMGRAAPQMNLLMIGFPIKITVGFFFMGLLFTIISAHMQNFTELLPDQFNQVIRSMSGVK